ncbi:peroxidase family protein [Amaricoccus sp.]|uniref:peroxidase family protein n=1 Tax=Amaricoccus sp. TaxID=1872485 RepID=UPI001B466EE8|nr:peroxidase family protein [Amaricoccus sp.]MBP7242088.1 hypothetical protein [Amaricoccus sp.]
MSENLDPSVNFADNPRPPDGDRPGNETSDGGRAGAVQIRLTGNGWYDDGTGALLDGSDRPNPRAISNTVFKQTDSNGVHIDVPNDAGFSSLLWVWGQFIDHDMDQTASAASNGSADITVPAGDPMLTQGGVSSIPFDRSTPASGGGAREFNNQITAFLDASMVYGSSQAKLDQLLVSGTAKLKLSAQGTIMFNAGLPVLGNGAVAGDTRAGENEALLSMQAVFAREHNRLVDELAAAGLTVEQQFQGARARVEAMVQAITFNEFLPKLLGPGWEPSAYTGHKSDVNPAITLEFSTAFYRLGHSMLSPSINRINENGATDAAGHLALRDAFQQKGAQIAITGVEDIFRGMATTKSQKIDAFVVEDIRSFLFNAGGGSFGQDLAALNIQRGRDHGLPTYNEARVALGLEAKTSFSQITSDPQVAARLSAAYGDDITKVDLWVGGLAEDAVGGGMVGELFRAGLIDQFIRLRDGDPFWSQQRGFGAAELAELWSTRLSDVIARNTDVDDIQDDAFVAYNRIGGNDTANTLNGQAGNNLLLGFGGADTLNGGAADDHIVGGAGTDRLAGGAGNNVLIGGTEADTYVIDASLASTNEVRGWEAIDAFEFLNTAGRGPISLTDGANGAVIAFGQATVTMKGVTAAALNFVAPTVNADSAAGATGSPVVVSVLANDNDTDGDQATVDPTSVRIVDADSGSNGLTRTVPGEGTWSVNVTTGAVTFTPEAGFTGAATSISYTVADTFGQRSSPAAVNVTIGSGQGGNPPTVVADAFAVNANGSATFAILANDSDADGLDATSVRLEGADAGSAGRTRTVAGEGVWTVNATTGAVTFAPVANYTGAVTDVAYTVADTTGQRSGLAALDVTIVGGTNPGQTFNGSGNGNTQNGGAGNDTLNGNGGGDTQNGNGGNDVLNGGTGTDTSNGGDGNDIILISGTQARNDAINGGAGLADTIRITANGDATLAGTNRISNVEIFEGSGRAVLGTDNDDVLDFSKFAAVSGVASIRGMRGNDTITGMSGADSLFGGRGNDTLDGNGGGDTFVGGNGNDTFRFVSGASGGNHRIDDFDASGNDVIRLVGFSELAGLTNAQRVAAVADATTFDGSGATIDLDDLGGSGEIFLAGVSSTRLGFSAEDFTFG